MNRMIAVVLAGSVAGCSLLTVHRPRAPDQPGDCTISYSRPRGDAITAAVLATPLLLLGLIALVDGVISAADDGEDGGGTTEFHADSYKPWLLPTAIPAAVSVPFAASWIIGAGRVDACRRSRGMMTGDEEMVAWTEAVNAHEAELARTIEACQAAPPPGSPTQVTQIGPDLQAYACPAGVGPIGVHGVGRHILHTASCTYADPCADVDRGGLFDRIVARVPGIVVVVGFADRTTCAAGPVDDNTLELRVGDWAQVDAVISAARVALSDADLVPQVTVRIAVSPVCDRGEIEKTMPPVPPKPDTDDI